jgi:hypothetical protein
MGAIALVVALAAAALIPGRRARSAREDVAQMSDAGRRLDHAGQLQVDGGRRDVIVEEPYPVTEQRRDHV